MTASRDPDRLIHAFFAEGLDELPDPVYDAVRDRIEQTRQRAVIGPWRTSDMNRYLKIGLAAAAVVVIAVVGYNLLPGSPAPGGEASASPEPSVAEPSAAESSTAASFLLWADPNLGPVTLTIPGSGWEGVPGNGLLLSTTVADTGIMPFTGDLWIYGDPCAWSTTTPDTAATTAAEVIVALASQASRDASAPADITIGEYAGQSVTLHVPADIAVDQVPGDNAVFPDCDEGNFGTLTTDAGGFPLPAPERHAQGAGQIDEMWVVDVDGVPVLLDLIYWADTPQDVIDDLHAIAESATFGP